MFICKIYKFNIIKKIIIQKPLLNTFPEFRGSSRSLTLKESSIKKAIVFHLKKTQPFMITTTFRIIFENIVGF